jgi:hypothetical protein
VPENAVAPVPPKGVRTAVEDIETPPVALLFPGISPSRFADVGRFMLINPVAR